MKVSFISLPLTLHISIAGTPTGSPNGQIRSYDCNMAQDNDKNGKEVGAAANARLKAPTVKRVIIDNDGVVTEEADTNMADNFVCTDPMDN